MVIQKSQTAGLEPARAEPSGFRVHPLNRLGTTASAAATMMLVLQKCVPLVGLEPTIFGLGSQRLIH